MHTHLTPELESDIRTQIESGAYSEVSDLIEEALRLKMRQDEIVRPKISALREAIVVGENSGVSVQFDILEITN